MYQYINLLRVTLNLVDTVKQYQPQGELFLQAKLTADDLLKIASELQSISLREAVDAWYVCKGATCNEEEYSKLMVVHFKQTIVDCLQTAGAELAKEPEQSVEAFKRVTKRVADEKLAQAKGILFNKMEARVEAQKEAEARGETLKPIGPADEFLAKRIFAALDKVNPPRA